MDRRLFNSVMSIATATIILVVSFVLWQKFNNEEGKLIAESYGELPLSMKDNAYDTLLYGNNIEEQDIIVNFKNMNNLKRNENLYLVVDPLSSINEKELSFIVNGVEYEVNDLNSEVYNGYLCYFIETLDFNEYEELELHIEFKKNTVIDDNLYLIYNFQII